MHALKFSFLQLSPTRRLSHLHKIQILFIWFLPLRLKIEACRIASWGKFWKSKHPNRVAISCSTGKDSVIYKMARSYALHVCSYYICMMRILSILQDTTYTRACIHVWNVAVTRSNIRWYSRWTRVKMRKYASNE